VVSAGEGYCGGLRAATASDVDLCALHIELGARIRRRSVKRDDLRTEEVIARGYAGWDRDGLQSLGGI